MSIRRDRRRTSLAVERDERKDAFGHLHTVPQPAAQRPGLQADRQRCPPHTLGRGVNAENVSDMHWLDEMHRLDRNSCDAAWARWPAWMPPAISIWESTQPPKISPLGFASAGMASVRVVRSPCGCIDMAVPQTMLCPPFADIVEPVMKPASSDARNSTVRAISCGSPRRPTGIRGRMFLATTSGLIALTISVAI